MIGGTVRFLIDKEDNRDAIEIISQIMYLAAAISSNCIVSWEFPTEAPPIEVEVTAYQLQEQLAGFLGDAIAAARRH